MKSRTASRIMLALLALGIFALTFNIHPTSAAKLSPKENFPYEHIFRKDLRRISKHVPQIELIYIVDYYNIINSALIRINYTSGLSDDEKISLQYYIQQQLESKWYVNTVEPNYIYESPDEPPPSPPFIIGELIVGF